MRNFTPASYIREASIIKKYSGKLREEFLQPDRLSFAQSWKVAPAAYKRLVEEVLGMNEHTISIAMRRYSATSREKKMGALEVKRHLLLRVQDYANGNIDIETGQANINRDISRS